MKLSVCIISLALFFTHRLFASSLGVVCPTSESADCLHHAYENEVASAMQEDTILVGSHTQSIKRNQKNYNQLIRQVLSSEQGDRDKEEVIDMIVRSSEVAMEQETQAFEEIYSQRKELQEIKLTDSVSNMRRCSKLAYQINEDLHQAEHQMNEAERQAMQAGLRNCQEEILKLKNERNSLYLAASLQHAEYLAKEREQRGQLLHEPAAISHPQEIPSNPSLSIDVSLSRSNSLEQEMKNDILNAPSSIDEPQEVSNNPIYVHASVPHAEPLEDEKEKEIRSDLLRYSTSINQSKEVQTDEQSLKNYVIRFSDSFFWVLHEGCRPLVDSLLSFIFGHSSVQESDTV